MSSSFFETRLYDSAQQEWCGGILSFYISISSVYLFQIRIRPKKKCCRFWKKKHRHTWNSIWLQQETAVGCSFKRRMSMGIIYVHIWLIRKISKVYFPFDISWICEMRISEISNVRIGNWNFFVSCLDIFHKGLHILTLIPVFFFSFQ